MDPALFLFIAAIVFAVVMFVIFHRSTREAIIPPPKVIKAERLSEGDSPWDHTIGYAVRFKRNNGQVVDALAHNTGTDDWLMHDFRWKLIYSHENRDLYDAWTRYARGLGLGSPNPDEVQVSRTWERLFGDSVGETPGDGEDGGRGLGDD